METLTPKQTNKAKLACFVFIWDEEQKKQEVI